jgi:hypothetical protein
MTTHGVIEIAPSDPVNSNRTKEMFVTLQQFLTSSQAISIGINRIAAFTNGGGANFDYASVGNNAFAVYEWSSATTPFYVMFHLSMTGALGWPPESTPTLFDGVTNIYGTTNAIGFSVAMRTDGGNPWGGTTYNNGYDSKGTPVWTDGGSTLLVWPRSNNAGGVHATNRENLTTIFFYNNAPFTSPIYPPYLGSRLNFLCDEENLALFVDPYANKKYKLAYFGRYAPIPGTESTNLYPYVMFRSRIEGLDPALEYDTYGPGTIANPALVLTNDGGIAHTSDPTLGVKSVYVCAQDGFLASTTYQPNTTLSTPTYDEMPYWIAMNEAPYYAIAGTLDFIRAVWGVETYDTDIAMTRAVFGGDSINTQKVSVPWDPVIAPNSSWATRTGSIF